MEISPRELRDVEIRESLRGYNRDEVNDLLERAAATIQGDVERIQQLTERLASAQSEAGRTRETEDVLHRTLLLAQRAADEAVAEATAKARQMTDDAELQARRLIADAESEARNKGQAERSRLEAEIVELAGRRDALLADVEALNRFESEYRDRMTKALESDLYALRSRPTSAPGARPETSDIEVPPAPVADAPFAAVAAVAADAAPVVEDQPQAAAPPAAEPEVSNGSNASVSTHEVDVRSLFETSQPVAAVAPDEPAPVAEAPQANDLLVNDGADTADVLDDDAFFATLRDAVHDDAPLGPRDEDPQNAFFDQDDEDRGSFRDVFRRRR